MARQTRSHATLLVVALAAMVVLAGCSSLPIVGDSASSCGPGQDEIGSITNSSRVNVTGALQSVNESVAVIDDGTGTAALRTLGSFNTDVGSSGDCVSASGIGQQTNGSTYDAQIIVFNASIRT